MAKKTTLIWRFKSRGVWFLGKGSWGPVWEGKVELANSAGVVSSTRARPRMVWMAIRFIAFRIRRSSSFASW